MAGSRRRARRKSRSASAFSWLGLLALAVILGVLGGGALWFLQKPPAPPGKEPPRPDAPAGAAAPAKPAEPADRFEFYDVLPDARVDVPREAPAARPSGPPPVTAPGAYVVQAGAYPAFADADRVRARLMLLNVKSQIQEAEANGTSFHRVRIGPIENLDELNRLREKLRQNGIEFLVIPVGE